MKIDELTQANEDYKRIEKAIKYLETNFPSQPGLKEVAGHIGLSEYHFQRVFSRWVGISPKRFLQFLTRIPFGSVVTYEDVAVQVGIPKATRAGGTAVGHNPISYIIPCHRVIRKNAEFGNYGGGPARKKAILGWEAARINLHP